ncbi:hypothetical protein [Rossellomorea marisflavi]|uniref:hypothetical protein n=1 Tax=Rossellomorea marisflavi TaxID=189381 RepID=UPI00064EACEA|nr:hypothetical protein [Rossellomorea marisflavi]KML08220.1 hypothetical protein VL06_01780 [Rossellomorea marisflavi]KML26887.1 hypothetical protein VL12_21655 [Rossellomorea marisflavi]
MENQVIRLKDDYMILSNPRDRREVIVLDKKEEKIILKFNLGPQFEKVQLDFEAVLRHFVSYQSLSGSIEGKLAIKLLQTHPRLFDLAGFTNPALKEDYIQYEFGRSIRPESLYETYRRSEGKKTFILWGISETSLTLSRTLSSLGMSVSIVEPSSREREDIQLQKLLTMHGSSSVEELYGERVQWVIPEDQEGVWIIDNRLLELNLIDAERALGQIASSIAVHYGCYTDEFTVGPLVLKEESYGYTDFRKIHGGTPALPTVPQSMIQAGLIQRILYFIHEDTLKHLAEDVQLPINGAFAFDNDSFNSKLIDIEGGW